jgi:hypothetical protein
MAGAPASKNSPSKGAGFVIAKLILEFELLPTH